MASILTAFVDGYTALGLDGGKPVYPGNGPTANNLTEYTIIAPTGGMPLSWPSGALQKVSYQINVYGPADTFGVPYERACAAYDALHERAWWQLEGYLVLRCVALQPPYTLGTANGLTRVVFNVLLSVRRTA